MGKWVCKHVFYCRASAKVKAGWRAQVHRIGVRAFSPAFATDKLSAGVLEASTTTLTWRLLRAPDGLVLDSIALSK